MIAVFRPSAARGTLAAPPSKSMAHRLLLCAGLAAGESQVRGVAFSQDILATLDCLEAMGAAVRREGGTVHIRGCDALAGAERVLDCRECGSTLRFFIPLCLLSGRETRLTGSETLLSRPLSVYAELCRDRGLVFSRQGGILTVRGPLPPGAYPMRGDVSSQFISGLLFALPLLPEDSGIRLLPPVESRPYIDMTLEALHTFGVSAWWDTDHALLVPGGQRYVPGAAEVEGDWSNGAFFLALNALGGTITVTGLRADSLQGDRVCAGYLEQLAQRPAELDISHCPDLGPVLLSVMAACHGGRLTGTRRLSIKESDRGAAMTAELAKFGIPLDLEENRITVPGGALHAPVEPLDGHNDHRIVMALSILCAKTGGQISGAEAVNKSFPDFFDRLREVGIEVEEHGMDQ